MAASRNYEFNFLLSYNAKETVLISVVGIRHVVIKFSTIFILTWRSEVTVFSSFFYLLSFWQAWAQKENEGKNYHLWYGRLVENKLTHTIRYRWINKY